MTKAHSQGSPPAPAPYQRGWRAPWRKQWGGFDDGHTRLSYLARKIERTELSSYDGSTPERARLKRQAARFLALLEMVSQQIGTERNAPRRLTALQASTDRLLNRLDKIGARVPTGPVDLARQLSVVPRERGA